MSVSDDQAFGFRKDLGIKFGWLGEEELVGEFAVFGPVGVEQLTSFKYRVRGNGQLRP